MSGLGPHCAGAGRAESGPPLRARSQPSQLVEADTQPGYADPIERLNGEFRRGIKTQTLLPRTETVPMMLSALLASGQIRIRKVDGWKKPRLAP